MLRYHFWLNSSFSTGFDTLPISVLFSGFFIVHAVSRILFGICRYLISCQCQHERVAEEMQFETTGLRSEGKQHACGKWNNLKLQIRHV